MSYEAPSLSRSEVAILAQLALRNIDFASLEDMQEALGPLYSRRKLYRLAEKGALTKIQNGSFVVNPLAGLTGSWGNSPYYLLASILKEEPYYVGGLTALSLNGQIRQTHFSHITVFVQKARRKMMLGGTEVSFHQHGPKAFGEGLREEMIQGSPSLWVSASERTLVDLLDYPHLLGGFAATLETVKNTLPTTNLQKLCDVAALVGNPSTCQRLGVILESHSSTIDRAPLLKALEGNKSETAMNPNLPRRGHKHPIWGIIQNDLEQREEACL